MFGEVKKRDTDTTRGTGGSEPEDDCANWNCPVGEPSPGFENGFANEEKDNGCCEQGKRQEEDWLGE